jgi:hypothetical protein
MREKRFKNWPQGLGYRVTRGQFKHPLMADFLKVEGGRGMVDQFKHPLTVMVDGGWWMVIFEKN